jgi:phospholipase C
MDRLDAAAVSWRFYTAVNSGDPGYLWAVCPTFAECLHGSQHANVLNRNQFFTDTKAGDLPAYTLLLPMGTQSQHNQDSMIAGDNYIAKAVSAVQAGPDWASTAIFITYDDCGCFSDHVAPPPGEGPRVPMVIVSPFARPGSTDSTPAGFSSILAFVEHNWRLPNLGGLDATAYDYRASFNWTQQATRQPTLLSHPVPSGEPPPSAAAENDST